ncbi:Peroxisome biosynthesis protein pex1 [Exophiala xenobiotica]|uniref:Peroxisomal ATPase PEX1 n=1 Tax=Lithohypha guttulata TaxID=1690604 RepID=A0ABR0KPH9_9EURO|nr:Peroxisome biosynthesis protein pex1 [Lithohypha guttulata]KAK5328016.1 Peroxisome biosynthesis protein pex1 [Exophiala xenobiotica]
MSRSVKVDVVFASLKNCLVNLPPSLIALVSNTNTPVQNVVVELQFRSHKSSTGSVSSAEIQRTAFAGWTGMPSRTRPTSVLDQQRSRGGRDGDTQTVEIDGSFAKTLGLAEGQQIGLMVHLDPPLAHTVNIEPLTPSDWEIIEMHATFLELNFLSQIRALPNPAYSDKAKNGSENAHPLTLHLSPTSTANIIVTSLVPSLSSTQTFAKIAADAEVIVAPKARQRQRHTRTDTRSTISKRSVKSETSNKTSTSRRSTRTKEAVFLRGVDYSIAKDFVKPVQDAEGLTIWLSRNVMNSESLKNCAFARVSVVKPSALRATPEQDTVNKLKEEDASVHGRPASRLTARVVAWDDPVNDHHAILSPMLSKLLDVSSFSGLVLKVDAAPDPVPRSSLKRFAFFPFLAEKSKKSEGLKFGGESQGAKNAISDRLRITYGGDNGILAGPLTDGMLIPASNGSENMTTFDGGILRFTSSNQQEGDSMWAIGGEQKQDFDVKDPIPRPVSNSVLFPTFADTLPTDRTSLIGVDKPFKQCMSNLTLCSSVLLTGGIGAGKTAVAAQLGHHLREEYLFNVSYLSCQKLVTDEIRVSSIKEELTRMFVSAAWCTRLGGQSVVILDDVDKICPVETELQVGNDNGRSRQVTEILSSVVRQYCSPESGVTLLATAQGKDALNNVIIGGHVFSEIISIPAPPKDIRNKILEHLVAESTVSQSQPAMNGHSRNASDSSSIADSSWMNPSNPASRPSSSNSASPSATAQIEGFHASPTLDLLDIAGKTDGYMPADLHLLVSRARNEALIRTISDPSPTPAPLTLSKTDFAAALRNFTPASLRNVTLTHSTTTFASVGGLTATRNTLLETLLYPTKYAPIFARSPLRLRSGLLLYGYPGCGKTLLASAVAGECNLNFISVKGPEILNKYIGASEKSVRDLFERAQAAKPCVLFFDEFDSIASKRGHDSTGVTDRVVNQMLTQMDGAEGLEGVYVLAATSRPDLIDPALLRPGRLDKSLLCDMPGLQDREDILRAVSAKLELGPGVEERIDEVAARTEGMSGADLQALMYNAHLEAIHELLGDLNGSGRAKGTVNANGAKTQSDAGERGSSASSSSSKGKKGGNKHDFVQFLYGKEEDDMARRSVTSTALDARAVIVAKLDELKLARKREKAAMKGLAFEADAYARKEGGEKGEGSDKDKVYITWQHMEKSLASTKASISAQERRRLAVIYGEFVQGRNGEMPNGEGNKEIGGRTSLM